MSTAGKVILGSVAMVCFLIALSITFAHLKPCNCGEHEDEPPVDVWAAASANGSKEAS